MQRSRMRLLAPVRSYRAAKASKTVKNVTCPSPMAAARRFRAYACVLRVRLNMTRNRSIQAAITGAAVKTASCGNADQLRLRRKIRARVIDQVSDECEIVYCSAAGAERSVTTAVQHNPRHGPGAQKIGPELGKKKGRNRMREDARNAKLR